MVEVTATQSPSGGTISVTIPWVDLGEYGGRNNRFGNRFWLFHVTGMMPFDFARQGIPLTTRPEQLEYDGPGGETIPGGSKPLWASVYYSPYFSGQIEAGSSAPSIFGG